MHKTGKQLLNLMFRPGERTCCSIDKFGYHSIPLENAFSDKVTLLSPNANVPIKIVNSDDLTLVALNPMKSGYRLDENCSAYRNFLLELDVSDTNSQIQYIKKLGIPYSSMVFSGSKSVHTVISLDKDLNSEKTYRLFAEWMLNVYTLCDQAIKNPSRSTRIPGAIRDTGKKQELLEFKGPVKLTDLVSWFKLHPNAKPKEKEKRVITDKPDIDKVKPWVKEQLYSGVTTNRNRSWFAIAVEFALCGFNESATIEILGHYFSEDRTFKEKEWLITIESAFKYAYERKR
jgi:hypothetical protein